MGSKADYVIMHDKYYVERGIIDSGSYGKVYKGYNILSKKSVAIKAETIESDSKDMPMNTQLIQEFKIYKKLNSYKVDCVPTVYDFYFSDNPVIKKDDKKKKKYIHHQYLIMDLLDISLEKLVSKIDHFTIHQVFYMAFQMIRAIKLLHNIGWLHRDITPNNFAIKNNKIYLIDYGLAVKWMNKVDKYNPLFVKAQSSSSIVGTYRYMSINALQGKECSWRDDLESIGYCLIYLLRGSLPWQGCCKNMSSGKDHNKIMKIILKKKLKYKNTLCNGLPEELKLYMKYCWSLKIDAEPNYNYFIKLFKNATIKLSKKKK